MNRLLPDLTIEQELVYLQKLFFLASRDHLYFDFFRDEDTEGTPLGAYQYYILEKMKLAPEEIDFCIKLYQAFGSDGLNAWSDQFDQWALKYRKMEGAYQAAAAYLKKPTTNPEPIKDFGWVWPSDGNNEFVVTRYPNWGRVWPDLTPEQELERFHQVVHLSALDVIAFGTYDESETEIRCKGTWTPDAKPFLIVNDTFAYACADAERFTPEEMPVLIEAYNRFSYHGLTAWASIKRCYDPIKPHLTEQFYAAKTWLEAQ
jgi:hypothetical protein